MSFDLAWLEPTDARFIRDAIGNLTTKKATLKVSEWAEKNRYLPAELTSIPGFWRNSVTPYLVEIMDCLSDDSPVRKVAVMKGVQIGATTGILENFIGYTIHHAPSGLIYISADKELTKLGIELKVDRMLHHSGLTHLLGAPDGRSKRSGDTAQLKEFPGGFLLAVGARNPGKLRSTSSKKMVLDELDGMPLILGGIGQEEGSPITISEMRTATFESSRKILYLSTPLKQATSLIHPLFLRGDQRHYYVPCRHCERFQVLDWHGVTEGGKTYGIVFELDDDEILIPDSVAYQCQFCDRQFHNHDKSWFLQRGEWRAHAKSQEVGLVSFHLPAFYSPPGQQTWTGCVYEWLKAWDVKHDRVRDIDSFQAFYNLQRGLPWEEQSESPTADRVRDHRRVNYIDGQIPNGMIVADTGAPAVLLTAAVDVHKDRLDVEVVAWAQDRQSWSIEWLHLEGDPDCPPSEGCWKALGNLIENKRWVADDGREYGIITTLIDVGWAQKADAVYQFCMRYSGGVFPCMGRKNPMKGAPIKEFQQSQSAGGMPLFNITAGMYKDRFAAWIKSAWRAGQPQPTGYPNFPENRRDDFYDELAAEGKFELIDPRSKQRKGYEWRQIKGRPNHALDCRVYGMAAFDMIVNEHCQGVLELENMSYIDFFAYATPKRNTQGVWLPNPFSYHRDQLAA